MEKIFLYQNCGPATIRMTIKKSVGVKRIQVGANEFEADKLIIIVDPYNPLRTFTVVRTRTGSLEIRQDPDGLIGFEIGPEIYLYGSNEKPSDNFLEVTRLISKRGKKSLKTSYIKLNVKRGN